MYEFFSDFWPENDFRYYLQHHGVSGQKWGVRNAEWYPIADWQAHLNRTGGSEKSEIDKNIKMIKKMYGKNLPDIVIEISKGIDNRLYKDPTIKQLSSKEILNAQKKYNIDFKKNHQIPLYDSGEELIIYDTKNKYYGTLNKKNQTLDGHTSSYGHDSLPIDEQIYKKSPYRNLDLKERIQKETEMIKAIDNPLASDKEIYVYVAYQKRITEDYYDWYFGEPKNPEFTAYHDELRKLRERESDLKKRERSIRNAELSPKIEKEFRKLIGANKNDVEQELEDISKKRAYIDNTIDTRLLEELDFVDTPTSREFIHYALRWD